MTKYSKRLLSNYYNSHYKYVHTPYDHKKFKRNIFNEYESILNKNKRILDIGTGSGYLLRVLEHEGYDRLSGIDIDPNQLSEARKHLSSSNLFLTDAARFLAKTRLCWDIIFMLDFVEHVNKQDVVPILVLAKQRLSATGKLVIQTPNADSPFFASRMRYIDFTHTIIFNCDSIKSVLREAGFKKITVRAQRNSRSSLKQLIILLAKTTIEYLIRFYYALYFGKQSFKTILTPNIIVIAQKQ